MITSSEMDLLVLAERQHGVFTRQQAVDLGLTTGVIDQRMRTFRWEVVQPSTYRVVGVPYTLETDVMAAVLAARQPVRGARPATAAASFGTAAALHGLTAYQSCPHRDPVEITVSNHARPELWWDTVVHRTLHLDDVDLDVVDAIPCTTGARFAVDHASTLAAQVDVFRVVDDVIGGRCADRAEVHRCAARLAAGRRHAALVRDVTAPGSEDRFHSWLERTAATAFRVRGLPEPRWNADILDETGRRIAVADALFAHQRVVVELDGLRFHTTPAQLAKDKARDRRLGIRGYLVLRYTYAEVVERPDDVAAEIREALRARA